MGKDKDKKGKKDKKKKKGKKKGKDKVLTVPTPQDDSANRHISDTTT